MIVIEDYILLPWELTLPFGPIDYTVKAHEKSSTTERGYLECTNYATTVLLIKEVMKDIGNTTP